MSFKERIIHDYFSKNQYDVYKNLLQTAIDNGYHFVTLNAFNKNERNQVVLRHDIDTDIAIAKKMFAIEKDLGIKSTYYFRLSTYNKKLIDTLKEYGNEVSYHFEEIATYSYKHNLNNPVEIRSKFNKIEGIFLDNLKRFREKTGCDCGTIASHGDFINRQIGIINNEILTKKIREKARIKYEAYDLELMDNAIYCSDGMNNFIDKCNFNQENNYYLLVHPRTWDSAFFARLIEDTKRLFRGVKYKVGCKVHKAISIIKNILHLPKTKLIFQGEKNKSIYKYFTKPHPKYIIFQNKSVGAMLLKKPNNFEEYLKGKEKQNLRTSRNKCIKNGYIFKQINVIEHVDGILEINLSKSERQGHSMNPAYADRSLIVKHSENKICFGVFTTDGKIVSYCYLIDAGNFVIISRLLGHADYLSEGVMFYMISECVKLWIEENKWPSSEYFFYDTFFGASNGLKKFKIDLGFKPYKIKYKYIKQR